MTALPVFDPVPVLEQVQQQARYSDTVQDLAMAYEARVEQTGGDACAGAVALIERLRDEVGKAHIPNSHGRRPSQKERRRALRWLDQVLAEARTP